MSKLFSLKELEENVSQEENNDSLCLKYIESHEFKIESIKQLCGSVPGVNDIYFLWTMSSFNGFTFIPYVIKQCGKIEQLIISTYSINMRIADALLRFVNKSNIGSVYLLVSDSLKYRMPKVVDHLSSLSRNIDNIKIAYSWNHSKVTLIKTKSDFFIVEGSGNWSENAKNEQYIFLNSPKVYDFRAKWILNEFK